MLPDEDCSVVFVVVVVEVEVDGVVVVVVVEVDGLVEIGGLLRLGRDSSGGGRLSLLRLVVVRLGLILWHRYRARRHGPAKILPECQVVDRLV